MMRNVSKKKREINEKFYDSLALIYIWDVEKKKNE